MSAVKQFLRFGAVVAAATAATIGFIDGFAANPVLSYPWALPVVGACLGVGLGLRWLAGDELLR